MNAVQVVPAGTIVFERVVGPLTLTDFVKFAGAGGDFNPLHHDTAASAAAGFETPIAMGQFTVGLLAAALTDWCGVAQLNSLEVSFRAPVKVGDLVLLRGTVESTDPMEDDLGLTEVILEARVDTTAVVLGRASVVTSAERV